jgi:4-alpha-glucanotransferase
MEELKNFGFTHKSGIIMPVFSLPSPYGIGSFGKGAYDFVNFLKQTGQTCWQVLPLNPTSYGDSPYQSPASSAGNPYFIDLEILAKKRLLTRAELAAERKTAKRVDYGHLFNTRYQVLRLAHSRFKPDEAYETFLRENEKWLENYALFMALKVHYGFTQWTSWANDHKDFRKALTHKAEFSREMDFWRWCQFEFLTQWKDLAAYAHENGIMIIGDMPIYVAHDSVDVWVNPEQFLLDENFNPTVVAGCPPDGFSPDGQLWGNPIYNWKQMEQDGFRWWLDRIGAVFSLYDILRIDHFRGFAGYYNVPYGEPTARNGKWDTASGLALFRTIRKTYPQAKIIAEDLGLITEDVRELMKDTAFPGMKMLHFAFYDKDSENLPRMYTTDNCVVYAASHDSDCSYTWCRNISGTARRRFNRECPRRRGQHRVYDLIEFAFRSRANLAMVPLSDYLLLSNEEGRINEPATAVGNWSWRVSPRYNTPKLRQKVLDIATRTNRNS